MWLILVLAFLSATLLVFSFTLYLRLVSRSEEAVDRYERLVRDASDMILTLDLNGRFIDANPATLEQSGYSLSELKALPQAGFFPPEDYKSLLGVLRDLKEGIPHAVTVRYRTKDAQEKWISCRATAVYRGPRPTAILVIARDVTDDIMRTQSLRRSEQRFRSLVSSLDRAFFVLDTDSRFAGVFGRWVKSADINPTDFLGRTPSELAPHDASTYESALARVLGGDDVTFQTSWPSPSGSIRSLRVSLSPMRDPSGEIAGIAGSATDITRRLRVEKETDELRSRIAEAERIESLGKLVSGVAHELNNPLAAILNFTEDLLLDVRDQDERAALEIIQAQALRSRTIVRDLLTFVRKGHDRPKSVMAPAGVLDGLLRALQPGLPVGVRLRATLTDADTTPVLMDRAGIEQVVTNLVTNAAHASPGGYVWINTRRDGDWFEICVEDDGDGIRPDHLPRIFEPFFSTKPTGQGVGLGLSVSLGIVRSHDGTLEVANRDPSVGTGACFTMRLPVSREPIQPVSIETLEPPRRRPSLTPLPGVPTLLVVDDEAPIRRALRRYFERRGWVVDEAADGLDALSLLASPEAARRFDVVLCDLKMPGMSGPELFAHLKETAPTIIPRIIFVTGDVTGKDAAEFLQRVSASVLEKPFELAAVGTAADQLRLSLMLQE